MELEKDRWSNSLRIIKPELKNLYYKGNLEVLLDDAPKLAIVGSRRMTDYGAGVIEKWMPELVGSGVTIVSGFMYGVDQAAHRACIENGGKTIAVLGWGIDRQPVSEDEKLYRKVLEVDGLIVSEYGGKMGGNQWTFPRRNRIVAGIADAVLVIEAAERSGSLITARLAYETGKKLLAVPGGVDIEVAKGTNQLIKSGRANMVCSTEDVLAGMNLNRGQMRMEFTKSRG